MFSSINKTRAIAMLVLVALSATLSSFTNYGGEGFQIFLNKKVVLQQFGNDMNVIRTLKLDQASPNDELSIVYHHCGKVGKKRTITLRDDRDKIVKEWSFSDVNDAGGRMTCKVKDILALQKGTTVLKLYYASSEIPKGRQLAALSWQHGTVAKR